MLEEESDIEDAYFICPEEDDNDMPMESSVSDLDGDALEIFEFEREESVAEFVDKLHIRHDLYSNSESDSEDDDMVGDGIECNHIRRHDERLACGQVFIVLCIKAARLRALKWIKNNMINSLQASETIDWR